MGKIIAFANQKGGVGKTTTAINLAAALSERGKRVLLCDFDPQGNATSGFGVDPRSLETSVYDLIVSEDPDTKSGIVQTKWVDIIGANVNLAGAELDLIAMDHREARLKLVLDKVKDEYDYVFIDCPPVEIVADTQIIEKLADRTIFVVRSGLMQRSMLGDIEQFYKDKKFKNMSLILNGTKAQGGRYGHYYRYGYHYGYGYGYHYGSDKNGGQK